MALEKFSIKCSSCEKEIEKTELEISRNETLCEDCSNTDESLVEIND